MILNSHISILYFLRLKRGNSFLQYMIVERRDNLAINGLDFLDIYTLKNLQNLSQLSKLSSNYYETDHLWCKWKAWYSLKLQDK